jgi:hypothetical protein
MEVGASTGHIERLERGLALREVLAELQAEAADVFASSGLTVDRFLRERWDEAERGGLPA